MIKITGGLCVKAAKGAKELAETSDQGIDSPPCDRSQMPVKPDQEWVGPGRRGREMKERFEFSNILLPEEFAVVQHPEKWKWISSLTEPDVKPVHFPEYLEWGKKHGHSPSHRELFLVLAGNGCFLLGDKVYRLRPGMVLMFNNHERHDWDLAPWNRGGFRHLWLHISNSHSITSNLNEVDENEVRTDNILKLISGHNPKVMMELWNRCSDRTMFSPMLWVYLKSVITTCFYESLSDWQNQLTTHPHELVVASVREHIVANLDKELTLESLSKLAGYSPYFFHRIFLRYSNKPLHRFIIDARLERAKQLLEEGQSVSCVSEQIGMASPAYFSRFFKKNTNISPTHWLKIHQVQK